MLWMRVIIHNFTLLGGVGSGLLFRYVVMAKACTLPLQHRRFIERDLDWERITLSLPHLALVFAR